jgi:cell division transport system permease protein
MNPKDSAALMQYISAKPYIKSIDFVTKEEARKIYLGDGNEDWNNVLDYNPLPNAIYFKLKKDFLTTDTLNSIKKDLEQQTYVSEVQYQQALVDNLNKNIKRISVILLGVAIILSLVVIILIDNTIRLAMFSNRFLIKTMQMVGATRWFIAKPMNIKAAIAAVFILIMLAERLVPELKAVHDSGSLLLLFLGLIVLGVCITLFSTHRSVLKYLRMKLDDLY